MYIKNNRFTQWIRTGTIVLFAIFSSACNTPPGSNSNGEEKPATDTTDNASHTRLSENAMNNNAPRASHMDIDKPYLLGKVNAGQDSMLVEIPVPIAHRSGLFLHRDALEAFLKMRTHAKSEGVHLQIISAFRSYNHQRWIWNSKFNGEQLSGGKNMLHEYPEPQHRVEGILKYSAMPGTSRHHWGTDIDLNKLSTRYFQEGKGVREYQWLKENAREYGFCQPYTPGRKDGYNEEPWHWSYMPLAESYMYNFMKKIDYSHLGEFHGSEYAEDLNVIHRFVINNINPRCNTP